jgi:hypothetical protein
VCTWAAHNPNLLCVPFDSLPGKEVSSVSIDSGRVERLGQLPGADYLWPFFSGADDRSIYFGRHPGDELVRWDLGTQQITVVEKINGWGLPGTVIPAPNEHWIGRRIKDTTEIRPFAGGEWRPLLSLKPTHISFTPDGNWLLYRDVDAAGKDALFRVPTAGGSPERMGPFPSVGKQSVPSMKVSPDGRKILAGVSTAPEVWLIENFEPKQQAAR